MMWRPPRSTLLPYTTLFRSHQARALKDLEGRFQGLLEDRAKAQLVIESLNEQVQQFDNLRRDRAKAQLIMDSQHEQLKQFVAERDTLTAQVETLKAQLKEHKAILKAAKAACRKKGRCFQIQTGPKIRRPFKERVARELRRLPGNLGLGRKKESASVPPRIETIAAPPRSVDRYERWIAEH